MFLAGGPGKPIELGDAIHDTITDINDQAHARIGFAYATQGGIDPLCKDGSGEDWRDSASSEWLIGLDQGITEPDALRELAAHSEADVRVLIPDTELSKGSLYKRPRFHAKIAFIESTSLGQDSSLITSSANLTGSALENRPTNYEVGLMQSTDQGLSSEDIEQFNQWWKSAWSQGTPVTDSLLDQYEEVRQDFFQSNPEVQEFESSTSVNHASEATNLWIETKKMTGGAGNQTRFNVELSPFFDTKFGEIVIEFKGDTYPNRSVNPRVTDPPFGMNVTPVYLPPGPDYKFSVIHLERLPAHSSGKPRYKLTVAEPGDEVAEEWRRRAEEDGVIGNTGGGREFGYY